MPSFVTIASWLNETAKNCNVPVFLYARLICAEWHVLRRESKIQPIAKASCSPPRPCVLFRPPSSATGSHGALPQGLEAPVNSRHCCRSNSTGGLCQPPLLKAPSWLRLPLRIASSPKRGMTWLPYVFYCRCQGFPLTECRYPMQAQIQILLIRYQ